MFSLDRHTELLNKLCRLCGKRKKLDKGYCKPKQCSHYSEVRNNYSLIPDFESMCF